MYNISDEYLIAFSLSHKDWSNQPVSDLEDMNRKKKWE